MKVSPSVPGPCKFNTQFETKCSTWSKCRHIAESEVVFFWGHCGRNKILSRKYLNLSEQIEEWGFFKSMFWIFLKPLLTYQLQNIMISNTMELTPYFSTLSLFMWAVPLTVQRSRNQSVKSGMTWLCPGCTSKRYDTIQTNE